MSIRENLKNSQKEGYKENEYIRYIFGKQFNILYTVTNPLAITNDGASVAVKSLTAWRIQL